MQIPNKKKSCLWCRRRLVHESYQPAGDVNFGPVPRSKEHIIPHSLFGKITTYDLCKFCNKSFGDICDFALVEDDRIIDAARKAGFRFEEIKSSFEMMRESSTGRKVKTSFKNGSFQLRVQKYEDGSFSIPTTDGRIADADFEIAVQVIATKVLTRNRPGLSDRRAVALLARKFLEGVREAPSGVHFDPVLGESFRIAELPADGKVQLQCQPWQTDWSLAKCVFEFSSLLWPHDYLQYCGSVLDCVRDFLEKRIHDPVAGTGTGIFEFSELKATPIKQHEAVCRLQPDCLSWELTFFGTASWKFQSKFGPRPGGNFPSRSHEIRITNPFGAVDAPDATVVTNSF